MSTDSRKLGAMAATDQPKFLPIVFCPVCCSPADAPNYGMVSMTCPVCETDYTINLYPEIVATHSAH